MHPTLRSCGLLAVAAIGSCVPNERWSIASLNGPRHLEGVVDTVIEIPGTHPYGAAAGREIAYVTLHGGNVNALSVWDFRTRTYRHAIVATGLEPTNVTFSPDGRSAFVASQMSFQIERVNVRRSVVEKGWYTPSNDPFQVAVGPDGDVVYATGNAGWLYAFDAGSGKSRGAVRVGGAPNGVAVSADGHQVYLTHLRSRDVGVVDVATNSYRTLGRMDDAEGQGIVLSRDGTRIYTVSENAGKLYAFDRATGRRVAMVSTGPSPFGLALTPDGEELWVTTLEGQLRRFSTTGLTPISSLDLGGRLRRLAMDPTGRGAIIADERGRIIIVR